MKKYGNDPKVTLAMDMFSYRITKAVGAYLFALLSWCGLEMDPEKNRTTINMEGKLSTGSSALQALVVLTGEGLQIAHECCQAALHLSGRGDGNGPQGKWWPDRPERRHSTASRPV
jgi:acetate kinase